MTFDPRRICQTLNGHDVDYVVVGGFASAIHGSPLATSDVDIVPSKARANLDRLGAALTALGAALRTEGGAVSVKLDGGFLAAMPVMLNLTSRHGDIDIIFQPAGPLHGYDEWNHHATEVTIGNGIVIRIATLNDIIDSKRAAGRTKDIAALPYLESLRDELDSE